MPPPVPVWPAGISANPDAPVLYVGVPNASFIVALDYTPAGALQVGGFEAAQAREKAARAARQVPSLVMAVSVTASSVDI